MLVRKNYRITGIVQGVGFRPFIHRLAMRYELKGWVLNDGNGVLLEIHGPEKTLDLFLTDIQKNPPPLASIDSIIDLGTIADPERSYKEFSIKESLQEKEVKTVIPPDSNVCADCLKELYDEKDRRYRYPFINCTNCGPRYSIITGMPYDREKTTMHKFNMCPDCEDEYRDLTNRRYHAQPNACPVCGPVIEIMDSEGNPVITKEPIEFIKKEILNGKVLGVKGIGGFHLVVNAKDESAVTELRKRKKRDNKPFALMVRDVEVAKQYAIVSEKEEVILCGVERPIVLLKSKKDTLPVAIAPGNPNLGIMLPATPLHYLMLDEELPVLVMTSGNVSGNPIAYRNDDAIVELNKIVDYFVLNNRDIATRIDDSIVRVSNTGNEDQEIVSILRRSRGMAPRPIDLKVDLVPTLAFGSELKATTALATNQSVYVSQHIGDVKNDETFRSLLDNVNYLKNFLSINPEIIACDAHPLFRTTQFAQKNAEVPVFHIQHHHAHMAACMGENNLNQDVIGVIFDGTGYGLDGSIWGGEFLSGNYEHFDRAGHLAEFYLPGGDKAVKEPFRTGVDVLYRTYGDKYTELPLESLKKISDMEKSVYLKMSEKKLNCFQTTSAGRLFDAVSAIMDVRGKIEYEGQAAIELEALLNRKLHMTESYSYDILDEESTFKLDYRSMIKEIVDDLIKSNHDTATISRKFHSTIVSAITSMCIKIRSKTGIDTAVLSGGVFMNEFLLCNSINELRKEKFSVYFHKKVPTNDGGISLGQVLIANAINKQANLK